MTKMSDEASFTLPTYKSKTKAKGRSRFKPPPLFWFYVALTVLYGIMAVVYWLKGDAVYAVLEMGGAVISWRGAQRILAGREMVSLLKYYYLLIGLLLAAEIAGVPGSHGFW